VALTFADLMIVAVLVGLGCVVTYVSLQRALGKMVSELRQSTEHRLSALTNTLSAVEKRVEELSLLGTAKPTAKTETVAPVAKEVVHGEKETAEEVTSEMLVVIAAAVTAFLGKKVRIRSAKMLQSPYEIVNPWSQQGRVFVQASHNLRSRG
jgi:methylmalonyl-CoA carboxyltransferase large subunit